jgi:hypothetical protein
MRHEEKEKEEEEGPEITKKKKFLCFWLLTAHALLPDSPYRAGQDVARGTCSAC